MESPGAYVDDPFPLHNFAWFLCAFGPPPLQLSVSLSPGEGWEAVGVNCKREQLLNIQAQLYVYGLKDVCSISVCASYLT